METNDILRRRKTPVSSGFRRGLLQHDHLTTDTMGYDNKQRHTASSQGQIVVKSTYLPPESFTDNPTSISTNTGASNSSTGTDIGTDTTHWKTLSQNHQQQNNIDSLLYLSTPKPASIRRTIQSQTPSRTAVYNSSNNVNERETMKQKAFNPAHDLGYNSLLSYGCCCMQCVRTTEVGILENFGRFEALLEPGFHCIPWPLADIGARLSLVSSKLFLIIHTHS